MDLGNNKIKEIKQGAFNELTSLKCLYLSANNIEVIDLGVLSELTSLEEVYLAANKIKEVVLCSLPSLKCINLRGNTDLRIDPNAFNDSLKNLQTLKTSDSNYLFL